MANVNMLYDKYSQEDFLCHKLRPIDIKPFTCALCGKDVDAVICGDYCENCEDVGFPEQEA